MRYHDSLDADELRESDEYWRSVHELEMEDRAMEEYYESKYNI